MSYIYKIGDVSKILNISNEMIRYYEKCGVITPLRNDANQYREYTMMDIFVLTECLHYKSWGIKISDIKDAIYTSCHEDALRNMSFYKKELVNTIDYLYLKCRRIDQIIDYQKIFKFNLENYWIKMIPRRMVFEFAKGTQEQFMQQNLSINKDFGENGFFNDNLFFFDTAIEFDDNLVKWNYMIDYHYFKGLDCFNVLPNFNQKEQLCLCTVLKVESFLQLNKELFTPILDYAKKKGYLVAGNITAILVGRAYENAVFYRYLEIQLPVIIES